VALSDFWNRYGYTSADEFADDVGPYMPSLRYLGLGFDSRQSALLAYELPFTPAGNVALAIVTAQRLFGGTDFQRTLAGQEAGNYVNSDPGVNVPALVVPATFLVSINMQSGGQEVVNVVGVRNASGTAQGAADAVQTAWKVATGPLANLWSSVSYLKTRAMDLSSVNGAIAEAAATGVGGVASATGLATNAACALVKWNGSTRSASTRGRLYYGPLRETELNADGRTLTSTAQTAITLAFTNFRNSLSTSGYPLVVVSRKNSEAHTVTGHAVESVIATQRRRVRG